MNYLTVNALSKYYGDKLLFENITFFIDKGQKVALIAKNGTGKSSLIKILQGLEPPESGDYKFHKDITPGFLTQEPDFDDNKTIYQIIMHADNPILMASLKYEQALDGHGDFQDAMNKMDELQAWDYEQQVKTVLSKFRIEDLDQKVGTLSGGQKKRLALAILLLEQPDIFILDEPTNHLDMDMIEWLEDYLTKSNITLLMITHDRYFCGPMKRKIFCTNMMPTIRPQPAAAALPPSISRRTCPITTPAWAAKKPSFGSRVS